MKIRKKIFPTSLAFFALIVSLPVFAALSIQSLGLPGSFSVSSESYTIDSADPQAVNKKRFSLAALTKGITTKNWVLFQKTAQEPESLDIVS